MRVFDDGDHIIAAAHCQVPGRDAMTLGFEQPRGSMPQPIELRLPLQEGSTAGELSAQRLDLSLVVPALLVSGFWLRQDRPWGYALAVIINAKGAVYTLSLAVSSVIAVRAGFDAAANEFPLWMILAAGHAAATIVTLRRLRVDTGAQRAALMVNGEKQPVN